MSRPSAITAVVSLFCGGVYVHDELIQADTGHQAA
jgi:hypothetical protein